MKVDADLWQWVLVAALAVGVLTSGVKYYWHWRRRFERACFDAMLRMLLQPTASNIAALDRLLGQERLSHKRHRQLLYEAELEADCLSIMPTGEARQNQPFLQRRYAQILASASLHQSVTELVRARLESFSSAL